MEQAGRVSRAESEPTTALYAWARAALEAQNLPFELHTLGAGLPGELWVVSGLMGTGTVTRDELARAFEEAGIPTDTRQWNIIGPPQFPPPERQTGSLRAELLLPAEAHVGERLIIAVKLHNSTQQTLEVRWGDNELNAIIFNEAGDAVRWYTRFLRTFVMMDTQCLPLAMCRGGFPTLAVPLDRFNPRLPLPAGEYTVLVRLAGIKVPGTGERISITFPPRPLTIRP